MAIIKASQKVSVNKNNRQSYELKAKPFSHELLTTSLLTALGTATFVGIHHGYRKQRLADARVQDYVTGVYAQLNALQSAAAPKSTLTRFRYACQQAAATWQQAYRLSVNDEQPSSRDLAANDFSVMHKLRCLLVVCAGSAASLLCQKISH